MAIRHKRTQRLFVTGGTGFLGRHIVNGPATDAWEIIAPGSGSLDLRNREPVIDMIGDWKPTAIIHTAYRQGDRRSIVDASRHVAEAAAISGARLVHVSTGALFSGRTEPYTEHDPPTPVHDYGRDKADAELAVAATGADNVIVRTSLIYGTKEPSGHELAVEAAVSGRSPMSFFVDEIRSPVLVDDLAATLVDLAATDDVTGVLHLGGPDALSRADLAVLAARRHGWDESRLRFSTIAESGLERPARVVLDSSRARSLGFAVRGPASWE